MSVAKAVVGILILSAATVLAQSAPATPWAGRARAKMLMATPNNMTSMESATAEKRMQEMQDTLKKMHALLTRMSAKAASSRSKDGFAKANLEMWQLMLGQLDRQFEELRKATLEREDFLARRAALYKQADAKAALEARRAQGAMAARFAEQGAAAAPARQAAAGAKGDSTPSTPSAPVSASPKPK